MKRRGRLRAAASVAARHEPVAVGGFVPFSTVDYPGKLAAVIFCQGCVLRCPYCHNPHLQALEKRIGDWRFREVLETLERRRSLLDAVVFSGGEPMLQPRLGDAIAEAGALGYDIGLHTAGLAPTRLERLAGQLSWVGFDVKAPFEAYDRLGPAAAGPAAARSLHVLVASGVPFEARMTLCPPAAGRAAVEWARSTLPAMGVRNFALQRARRPDSAMQLYDDDGVLNDQNLLTSLHEAFETVIIRK